MEELQEFSVCSIIIEEMRVVGNLYAPYFAHISIKMRVMGNLYTSYFAHISIKMRVVGNLYAPYFAHISIKMRVMGKIQHFFGQYHDYLLWRTGKHPRWKMPTSTKFNGTHS